MRNVVIAIVVIGVLAVGYFMFAGSGGAPTDETAPAETPAATQ